MIHLLVAVTAAAFPAPAALDYQAPSGCPTASAFKDAIAARGGDLAAPSSPGDARVLVVSIRKLADGYAGAFQVREPEGVTGARQLRGATCAEVADALAVVAAIELRGEAGDRSAAPAPISPSRRARLRRRIHPRNRPMRRRRALGSGATRRPFRRRTRSSASARAT